MAHPRQVAGIILCGMVCKMMYAQVQSQLWGKRRQPIRTHQRKSRGSDHCWDDAGGDGSDLLGNCRRFFIKYQAANGDFPADGHNSSGEHGAYERRTWALCDPVTFARGDHTLATQNAIGTGIQCITGFRLGKVMTSADRIAPFGTGSALTPA